jgi:hypothetical protein
VVYSELEGSANSSNSIDNNVFQSC